MVGKLKVIKLDRKFENLCKGTNCSSCKYKDYKNCQIAFGYELGHKAGMKKGKRKGMEISRRLNNEQ